MFTICAALTSACGSEHRVTTPDAGGCSARSDCGDGGMVCVDTVCEGCTSSSQCKLDEDCDPVQRRCELLACFGNQCSLSTDCALGQYCVQGLCLDPGPADAQGCSVVLCGSDKDCNAGERCNPLNDVCEENLGCDPAIAPCAAGEVCNTATGACVPGCTAGTAASVCGPLVSCIDGRCVQCAKDSDCGPGLACDLSTGQCAGASECSATRDCPVNEACDAPTGTCIGTPRPPCNSNETCASDERCQTRTGTCVAGACETDRFYPNTTEATAAPISAGTTTQLTLCDPSQESWFSLTLNSGDTAQVVSDADPLGSFDLQLIAPDGTVLDEGQLAVEAVAGSTGTYFVRARTNDASVLYDLEVIVRPGTPCSANPGGVHSSAQSATPLSAGEYGGFTVCPGEPQFFVLRGDADAGVPGIDVKAALDPTQGGPLLLTLFDSDGHSVLAQDSSGGANLEVTAAMASGGNFFLEVSGASESVANAFDLTVRSAP